jgi:hypothetical protein
VENGYDGRRLGRCAIALLLGCSLGRAGTLEPFLNGITLRRHH